jgi:hypothetical protein
MGRVMVKSNLKVKKTEAKANLKVVKENSVKTTSYIDINFKIYILNVILVLLYENAFFTPQALPQ